MNFKTMSGNEILLNLDNCENLRNSELVSGLIELARKDKKQEFDWNHHPISAKCLAEVNRRLHQFTSKNVLQTALLLDRLSILDQELWNKAATHTLRLLHRYKGRDMAMFLDLFDKDILDDEGEPHNLRKANEEFFERIVGLLPMQIKYLNKEQLIRSLEVLVRRSLGSDRLFRDYLLLKIEKNILKFSVDQYHRLLRSLADKQYVEDHVFWTQYAFRFVFENHDKTERFLSEEEAKKVWDALIYLKLKCPSIDIKEPITRVESFIPRGQEEVILREETAKVVSEVKNQSL